MSQTADFAVLSHGDPPDRQAITMQLRDGRWSFYNGGPCNGFTVVPPPGEGLALWTLSTLPDPEATSFDVLVDAPGCSGGQAAGDRVHPPQIEESKGQVLITFTVDPLPPGTYTCQGVSPTTYTVHLSGPIGARALFDGAGWPPDYRAGG